MIIIYIYIQNYSVITPLLESMYFLSSSHSTHFTELDSVS